MCNERTTSYGYTKSTSVHSKQPGIQYLGPFMTDQNILTLLVFVVWEGGVTPTDARPIN